MNSPWNCAWVEGQVGQYREGSHLIAEGAPNKRLLLLCGRDATGREREEGEDGKSPTY